MADPQIKNMDNITDNIKKNEEIDKLFSNILNTVDDLRDQIDKIDTQTENLRKDCDTEIERVNAQIVNIKKNIRVHYKSIYRDFKRMRVSDLRELKNKLFQLFKDDQATRIEFVRKGFSQISYYTNLKQILLMADISLEKKSGQSNMDKLISDTEQLFKMTDNIINDYAGLKNLNNKE